MRLVGIGRNLDGTMEKVWFIQLRFLDLCWHMDGSNSGRCEKASAWHRALDVFRKATGWPLLHLEPGSD